MSDSFPSSFDAKLAAVLARTSQRLGPDIREQFVAMVSPDSIRIMAGVLLAWLASHAFGIGEAVDIIIGVVGVATIGMAVFSSLDELYLFVAGTNGARTNAGLDSAADHLAKAIAILGVQAVLAFLFRGRPQVRRSPSLKAPPPIIGRRYRPTTGYSRLPPGVLGTTNRWGDITISTLATKDEQALALLHEQVHSFLTPKFHLLRNFRVDNMQGSYFRSSLWRYIEEALAQTISLVGNKRFGELFAGIRFPVRSGYVFVTRAGGYSGAMRGKGLVPEGAGLLASGTIGGIAFELWFKAGSPSSVRERHDRQSTP